jgi:Protein of unknown function (DUF2934)
MNPAVEERIRTRAYELWEAEGRPGGREVEHWLQAAQEVAAANGESRVTAAAPPARRTRSATGGSTARRTATATPPAAAPPASGPPAAARPAAGRTRATKRSGPVS